MCWFQSISVFLSIKNNAVYEDLIIFQHFLGWKWSLVPLVLVENTHPHKNLQTCLQNILNCRQQLPHAVWTDDRVSKALIKLKKSQVIACSNFRGLWSNVWNIYWIWRVQREKTGSTAPTCQSSKLTSSSLWGKFCVQVGIILFNGFNVHTCNVYMYTGSWINTLIRWFSI